MARDESDREDLLREATAFPRRAEFRIDDPDGSPAAGEDRVLFGGLRETGTSLYLGADPAYHLDAEDRLRRAFVDGLLYRTQGATLARLLRHRTDTETELIRHDLDGDELASFLGRVAADCRSVAEAIETGRVTVLGSVPPNDTEILPDLSVRLRRHAELEERLAPAIPGRRT